MFVSAKLNNLAGGMKVFSEDTNLKITSSRRIFSGGALLRMTLESTFGGMVQTILKTGAMTEQLRICCYSCNAR